MLSFKEKITFLENYLSEIADNYADSFKTDILFFFNEFEAENSHLIFINKLNSKIEIYDWVDNLTSRIVLKFDKENEQLSDFISDYLKNGQKQP